jgi:hypothetical protein
MGGVYGIGPGAVKNRDVEALVNLAEGKAFSAFPLVPGTDVAHDTPAGVGALAASQGLTAGELVKAGVVTGLSTAAAGVVTSAVAFGTPFPTALDTVLLAAADATAGAVFTLYSTSRSASGFTINVDVTTAVASGVVSVFWVALGH